MLKLTTNKEDTFIGFFDLNACSELSLEPVYYIEIAHAELVGNTVHLLIKVWLEDQKQGFLAEAYDVRSEEFFSLIKEFFMSEYGRIASVSTGYLACVAGSAKLTKRNDRVVVDWSTFDAEELPCGELCRHYEE